MNNSDFVLKPITSAAAGDLRAIGGAVYEADSKPGYPCRQCLQDAEIGEKLILVSHDPFAAELTTPYRSASPIFLHEAPCVAPADLSVVPTQLSVRQLSVRSFDEQGDMVDAALIDGNELDDAIDRLFSEPVSTVLHVHNAGRGCWATAIRRAGDESAE